MRKLGLLLFILFLVSCKKEIIITVDNEYYKKARVCRDSNVQDSAFYYYNLSKNDYLKFNDSLGVGNCLVNMALIQSKQGDFYGSIESSLDANKFLKRERDSVFRNRLATNYNNIGYSFHFLKSYRSSATFFIKSLDYIDNLESKNVCYTNIGDAFILLGKYNEAKKYLQTALLTNDRLTYAKALNNLARAKFLEDKAYDALPELSKALKIRQDTNDIAGQNSSFSTLADYYSNKDSEKSLFFTHKLLKTADEIKIPEDQLNALQRLIILDPLHYLENFQRFTAINDSTQTARSLAKNQFALVRYDVEQKNILNQKLQAENKIERLKTIIGIGTLTIILFAVLFWYRKRKKHLEQEKQLEIKNTQLKMSKKVHDVVANGLYHMMIDVQNNTEMDKTKILNDIEKMYEESRDISHENTTEIDFYTRFGNMIASYNTPDQKVLSVGYNEDIWNEFSYNIRLELYYTVRELLVNMKKHSQAKLVVLKFEKDELSLNLKYTDNGVGIDDLKNKKGTGIFNVENRIEVIGGDINFEKNPKGGLIIQIVIPKN